MKSKYIRKSLKAIYGSAEIKECSSTRKTNIFGKKDNMYDQILTLNPMVQTVFEFFFDFVQKNPTTKFATF